MTVGSLTLAYQSCMCVCIRYDIIWLMLGMVMMHCAEWFLNIALTNKVKCMYDVKRKITSTSKGWISTESFCQSIAILHMLISCTRKMCLHYETKKYKIYIRADITYMWKYSISNTYCQRREAAGSLCGSPDMEHWTRKLRRHQRNCYGAQQ